MIRCSIDGCEKDVRTRGLCRAHYARLMAHGDPLAGRTMEGAPLKFLYQALAGDTNECVTWPFATMKKGYGTVSYNGEVVLTHRLVCRLAHGDPISEDLQAAHSCGNGKHGCINPKHLRWATAKENADDVLLHGHRPLGSKTHSAKLKEADVRQIRWLLACGSSQKGVASQFGIDTSTVSAININRIWKHLP